MDANAKLTYPHSRSLLLKGKGKTIITAILQKEENHPMKHPHGVLGTG